MIRTGAHISTRALDPGPVFLGFLGFLSLFTWSPAWAAEEAPATFATVAKDPSTKLILSSSGHFSVGGTDAKESLLLARWLEETSARVEQITGSSIPFADGETLNFTLHRMGNVEKPSVETTWDVQDGRFLQRLVVLTRTEAVDEDVQGALCLLLLNRYVWAIAATNPPGRQVRSVPHWLSEGLSQNLDAEFRARDAARVFEVWQEGKALSIAAFLEVASRAPGTGRTRQPRTGEEGEKKPEDSPAPAEAPPAPVDAPPPGMTKEMARAMSGVSVTWLLSLSESPARLGRIFARLAAGDPVSAEWLITTIPECRSLADLRERWDDWILRQKRVVHKPGVLTARSVEELRWALLLYPGDCGMPLAGTPNQWVGWRGLIGRRGEPWMPAFAANKSSSLRVSATGRGKEVEDVVECYAEFLEALGKSRSESRLKGLLDKAEQAMKDLESSVRPEPTE
jgi:hypothetical protein